jgi:hypothetical protein
MSVEHSVGYPILTTVTLAYAIVLLVAVARHVALVLLVTLILPTRIAMSWRRRTAAGLALGALAWPAVGLELVAVLCVIVSLGARMLYYRYGGTDVAYPTWVGYGLPALSMVCQAAVVGRVLLAVFWRPVSRALGAAALLAWCAVGMAIVRATYGLNSFLFR